MAEKPSQVVAELEEKIERMQQQLEELEESYGLDGDEGDTVSVEIPVGGRTNQTETVEMERDLDVETVTKEVEVPAGGRTNDETTTVEREVPVESGVEDIEDFKEWMHETQAESVEERAEAQKRGREKVMNASPYDLEEDAEDVEVPVAGRGNREDE